MDDDAYSKIIRGVKNIQSINAKVKVFASLKLFGDKTFPKWLGSGEKGTIFGKNVEKPDPQNYGKLLADYVEYLQHKEIKLDYLGVNNEVEHALTPDRCLASLSVLAAELQKRRVPDEYRTFKLVAPETFSVRAAVEYATELRNRRGVAAIDIAGSHTYDDNKDSTADWQKLYRVIQKPMWFTEVHIGPRNDQTNITRMRRSMGLVFDANKAGVTGFVWWMPGGQDKEIDSALKRELIPSMVGGYPVLTLPGFDPKDPRDDARLQQAYRVGDMITLWIANPGPQAEKVGIDLRGGKILQTVGSLYWQGPGNDITDAKSGRLSIQVRSDKLGFVIQAIPKNCIAKITLEMAHSVQRQGRAPQRMDRVPAALRRV